MSRWSPSVQLSGTREHVLVLKRVEALVFHRPHVEVAATATIA